jgi:hypothetical protein
MDNSQTRVEDPDSVTLRIRIRIGNPDPGARKLRNSVGKNALFSNFLRFRVCPFLCCQCINKNPLEKITV